MNVVAYQAINALLFALYMVGCGAAFILSRDNKKNLEQAAAYAMTVFVFYIISHLPSEVQMPSYKMGPTWYLVNAAVDAYIAVYAWRVKADASRWVLSVACMAAILDLVYYGFAASGNKLPGVYYFVIGSSFQSLQVLLLIVFSGPVIPAAHQSLHRIARGLGWLVGIRGRHERVIGHT